MCLLLMKMRHDIFSVLGFGLMNMAVFESIYVKWGDEGDYDDMKKQICPHVKGT